MKQMLLKRNIPVREENDIVIIGAGPSGIAAALAAAKYNNKVYLIEEQSCFGGMGTAGMVPAFMQFSDGINFLASGIGQDIYNKLKKEGGTGPDDNFAIRAEVLKTVYDELVVESGINFSLRTKVIGVETNSERIEYIICSSKSGIFAIKGKVFIDCTGDGDIAAWAGAPFNKGNEKGELMPGTLCSLWANLNWNIIKRPGYKYDSRFLEDAFKENMFTVEDRHLSGFWRTGETTGGGNVGHVFGVDGTDEKSLTKSLISARKTLKEYVAYYNKYIEGFANAELVATAPLLGIRETRRIIGDYVLNLEDYKKRAVFEDEVGRYCAPIDIHPSTGKKEDFKQFEQHFHGLKYKDGESYGIPYRTLIPQKLENLLVAGRCISTDTYVHSSIRVMPGCFITGQAAGIASTLAVQYSTTTRGVSVPELQKRLKNIGAFLPNA